MSVLALTSVKPALGRKRAGRKGKIRRSKWLKQSMKKH